LNKTGMIIEEKKTKRNERKEENNGLECVCTSMLRKFSALDKIDIYLYEI